MMLSPYPLLLTCLIAVTASAQDMHERSDLGLVQLQITAIEQLANRANSSSEDTAESRYRFDYPKFVSELERVRQGIHKYLSPSRAQPADLVELTGEYRAEASPEKATNEHD
ncbi:RAQPRD family integrative conjugative element protein [Pseudomonas putida]|uniref:integrative conjugative element protein, RAQPRD family n=1 Tax=Pseudomonas putida TaxID=303 RepID=UPI003905C3D1